MLKGEPGVQSSWLFMTVDGWFFSSFVKTLGFESITQSKGFLKHKDLLVFQTGASPLRPNSVCVHPQPDSSGQVRPQLRVALQACNPNTWKAEAGPGLQG